MNIKPNQIAVLAAIGIGVYVLTRKNPKAPTGPGKPPAVWAQNPTKALTTRADGSPNYMGGLLSAATTWLGGGARTPAGTQTIANDDLPGQAGYGWKYYSDGTSISPEGVYYKDGAQVWAPTPDGTAVNPPALYQAGNSTNDLMDFYG